MYAIRSYYGLQRADRVERLRQAADPAREGSRPGVQQRARRFDAIEQRQPRGFPFIRRFEQTTPEARDASYNFV